MALDKGMATKRRAGFALEANVRNPFHAGDIVFKPNFENVCQEISMYYQIESVIARKTNKLLRFNKKWSSVDKIIPILLTS